MSNPPPYTDQPPRYSQVVGQNPARYPFNGRRIFGVAHALQRQYTVPQQYFPEHAPFTQGYVPIYPNIRYQPRCLPNSNPYHPPISDVHPYLPPVQYYQPLREMSYHPQQVFHQPPGPAHFPTISVEQYGSQEPLDVPPPPEGYVLIQGTNIAVPKEWMRDDSEEGDKITQYSRTMLRKLKGKKRSILRKTILYCLYKLRDRL